MRAAILLQESRSELCEADDPGLRTGRAYLSGLTEKPDRLVTSAICLAGLGRYGQARCLTQKCCAYLWGLVLPLVARRGKAGDQIIERLCLTLTCTVVGCLIQERKSR
jgi:hypothetical protein